MERIIDPTTPLPVAVTTFTFMGYSLEEWVYVGTLILLPLQIYHTVSKILHERKKNNKNNDGKGT